MCPRKSSTASTTSKRKWLCWFSLPPQKARRGLKVSQNDTFCREVRHASLSIPRLSGAACKCAFFSGPVGPERDISSDRMAHSRDPQVQPLFTESQGG